MERFVEDYKFTACSGLIRWYHDKYINGDVLIVPNSPAPTSFSTDTLTPMASPCRGGGSGLRQQAHSTPTTPSSSSAPSSLAAAPSLPYTLLLAFSLTHCSQKMGLPGAGVLLPAAVAAANAADVASAAAAAADGGGKEEDNGGGDTEDQLEATEAAEAERELLAQQQQQKPTQKPPSTKHQQQQIPFDWQTFFQYYHMAVRRDYVEV